MKDEAVVVTGGIPSARERTHKHADTCARAHRLKLQLREERSHSDSGSDDCQNKTKSPLTVWVSFTTSTFQLSGFLDKNDVCSHEPNLQQK